jgi:cytochrome c biogenesis protein CcdA
MLSVTDWGLGLLLGMRHALEPDHLTAVSTLVARERRAVTGAWLGAWWGIGHMVSLVVIGSALSALEAKMPAQLTSAFELIVAAALIILGARSIRRAVKDARDCTADNIDGSLVRACDNGHVHVAKWGFATRSLLVGLLHGLAGSGTLVALVASQLPTLAQRIGYVAVFAVGAVVGMALLSGLAGIPLARLSRSRRGRCAVLVATGALSVAMGFAWILHVA